MMPIDKSKRRNCLRKSSHMQNWKRKLWKSNFPFEYSVRKCFCYKLLYFTSIIEIHIMFLCNKGIKITYAEISRCFLILQRHKRFSYIRGFYSSDEMRQWISLKLKSNYPSYFWKKKFSCKIITTIKVSRSMWKTILFAIIFYISKTENITFTIECPEY